MNKEWGGEPCQVKSQERFSRIGKAFLNGVRGRFSSRTSRIEDISVRARDEKRGLIGPDGGHKKIDQEGI